MSAEPTAPTRFDPGRFDPRRWVPALVALPVLAASALLTPATLPGGTVCALRRITGVPCPGCGLTRAFCCITHGDFARAWEFNPFAFALYAVALGALAWPVLVVVAPRACAWIARPRVMIVFWSALAVAMTLFGAARAWEYLRGAQ